MLGLWLENQRLSLRTDIPVPRPCQGEALIRLSLAGICATDLELVRGYYPFRGIIGHEFVGRVVNAPGFDDLLGERVVGEINIACQRCEYCHQGLSNHCLQRRVLGIKAWDGAFAEFLILPVQNLWKVPPEISDEQAVFVEPIAAVMEILEQVNIHHRDKVLVIGAGRLGQLIAASLKETTNNLGVVARYDKQITLLNSLGVQIYDSEQVPEGEMDLVIDASGSADGFELSMRAVRPRGTIVLKSTTSGLHPLNLSPLAVKEVTLVGSRCGPFKSALQRLQDGRADPIPLIDGRYSLKDGLQGIQAAMQPGALKVLLYSS